jgi:hypothetical protein
MGGIGSWERVDVPIYSTFLACLQFFKEKGFQFEYADGESPSGTQSIAFNGIMLDLLECDGNGACSRDCYACSCSI